MCRRGTSSKLGRAQDERERYGSDRGQHQSPDVNVRQERRLHCTCCRSRPRPAVGLGPRSTPSPFVRTGRWTEQCASATRHIRGYLQAAGGGGASPWETPIFLRQDSGGRECPRTSEPDAYLPIRPVLTGKRVHAVQLRLGIAEAGSHAMAIELPLLRHARSRCHELALAAKPRADPALLRPAARNQDALALDEMRWEGGG
jgi:hypothetical protein